VSNSDENPYSFMTAKLHKVQLTQTLFFTPLLTKNVTFFLESCYQYSSFVYPFISFGPFIENGSLMSALSRKAFQIEYSDQIQTAYLSIDEKIVNEEFTWKDFYKMTD